MTYDEVQAVTPFDIRLAEHVGRTDPNYCHPQRFRDGDGSLGEARAFLHHSIGCGYYFQVGVSVCDVVVSVVVSVVVVRFGC